MLAGGAIAVVIDAIAPLRSARVYAGVIIIAVGSIVDMSQGAVQPSTKVSGSPNPS